MLREKMTDNKLKGKDLFTIGIYTVLYIVALLVGSVATVLPVTFLFYPAVCAARRGLLCDAGRQGV